MEGVVQMSGYLYNGVLASDVFPTAEESNMTMPEDAATDYPYWTLSVCYTSGIPILEMRMFTSPVIVDGSAITTKDGESVQFLFYEANWRNPTTDEPDVWSLVRHEQNTGAIVDADTGNISNGYRLKWANFDVLDIEGNVYLAASEPVPIQWAGLQSWLIGYALGLAGKPLPINVSIAEIPFAYLYPVNYSITPDVTGVLLPCPREYDTATYPCLYIHDYQTAYAFTMAPTVKKGFTSTKLTPTLPYLKSRLEADENGAYHWAEWEEITVTQDIVMSGIGWTNHDILTDDGEMYLAACEEPIPVYLPCVLFEGDVTTTSTGSYPACTIKMRGAFVIGDRIRVTINGVSTETTLALVETSNQIQAGNAGLNGNDIDAEDDGGDWLVAYVVNDGVYHRAYFYTRNAGAYSLKIERIT